MFRAKSGLAATILISFLYSGSAAAAYVGGTNYVSFAADSPFAGLAFSGYFHLENFEDGLLNTPGVSGNGVITSVGFTGPIIDSVDEDDGAVNGQCNNAPPGAFDDCDSYFSGSGQVGITFTFNQAALGGDLPTHAGVVWTDGTDAVTFEAFDAFGASLGIFGPFNTAGGGHSDQDVLEDLFVGVIDLGGISKISIFSGSLNGGGIEVDHLQYGADASAPVPEPLTISLLGIALVGLGFSRRRNQ